MRAHRTLILSAGPGAGATVPAGAAPSRLIIGGSTSVLPLAQKLASAYHKAYPKIPAPKVSGGAVGHRHRGAAKAASTSATPRATRYRCRPQGLVFTKLARDGVCIITNDHNPARQPLPARGRRNLHGRSATGAK